MTKQIFKMSHILKAGMGGLLLASFSAFDASAEDLDELLSKAQQVQKSIDEREVQQQNLADQMGKFQNKYQKELSLAAPKGAEVYDRKIEEVRKQNQVQKQEPETNTQEEINPAAQEAVPVPAPAEKAMTKPLERSPRYVEPQSPSRGRRPFIRGDNSLDPKALHYAVRRKQERLSFAKEATQAYTGTTAENVFLFSDNLANYCEMDTTTLDKMSECLEKVISQRAQGTQTAREQMNELYQDSLIDTTSHAIADAARYKNDTSGYEKEVLLPLQEKSSKATDERGDIEVLTLTEMEALKLKNKLIQVYASQLGLDAFRDFGTYEVNNRDLTNIDKKE